MVILPSSPERGRQIAEAVRAAGFSVSAAQRQGGFVVSVKCATEVEERVFSIARRVDASAERS